MVFDGFPPLVQQWNGYLPSLKSTQLQHGYKICEYEETIIRCLKIINDKDKIIQGDPVLVGDLSGDVITLNGGRLAPTLGLPTKPLCQTLYNTALRYLRTLARSNTIIPLMVTNMAIGMHIASG